MRPNSPVIIPASEGDWWRTAVIYEIYPRSFADSNGDGEGDLPGIRSRLSYLRWLGVDAIWITPWYPSPMADGGYDVTDYRAIDPRFGSLADADALIAEAHAHGIRVIIDLVPNHTSSDHPWFRAALAAAPGSPERARYHFADGRGAEGAAPPNNWISAFGGSAWERVADADGRPGQWYLHQFAPEQPDLDWTNPDVPAEFDDILRFWFDRGVDGARLDAIPGMAKAPGLPDACYDPTGGFETRTWIDPPHWDRDEVHHILRRWRRIADRYPDRALIGEVVVNGLERLSRYVRSDELHTAFNLDFVRIGWNAPAIRDAIDTALDSFAVVNAPLTWVLSSHDETRHLTRFGRDDTRAATMAFDPDLPADLELGTRRARAALLLLLALPGAVCLYQGEELGLPEVTDLPDEVLQDPAWERSGHVSRGRDGCRVPLPWTGDRPPYGFSTTGSTWLPQPPDWARFSMSSQQDDPASMLTLYRTALALRRSSFRLAPMTITWIPAGNNVLHFSRGDLHCLANLGTTPEPLPPSRDTS